MAESYTFNNWGSNSEDILKSHFPMHRACRNGEVETLSLLLVEAQHGIYTEDSFYGWTPAHWAAYFGRLNCLMKLHGENTNCDYATIRLNQTPLHIAGFAGQGHCAKWLLHCGSAIDRQDYLGETPVHKAARTGSMECVSLLTSHGARLFIRNNNRMTPAEVAAACGHEECAKYLTAAAVRQETLPKGVFGENQFTITPPTVTEPSPHDVTAKPACSSSSAPVEPCVINHGLNAGKLPPPAPPASAQPPGSVPNMLQTIPENSYNESNGHLGDCAMEEGEEEMSEGVNSQGGCGQASSHGALHPVCNGHALTNGDITLDTGVSSNQVPVAGLKRCREDDDEMQYKRVRTADQRGYDELAPSLAFASSTHVAMEIVTMDPVVTSNQPESPLDPPSARNRELCAGEDCSMGQLPSDLPYQQVLAMSTEPMKPVRAACYPATSYYEDDCDEYRYLTFIV